jgi:hypothetical protein
MKMRTPFNFAQGKLSNLKVLGMTSIQNFSWMSRAACQLLIANCPARDQSRSAAPLSRYHKSSPSAGRTF